LDAIPGIGPARRKALLQKFGDIEAIRQATLEELLAVAGINEEIARSIQSGLE
jgi:excinuclease ABC subunit C